MQIVKEFGSNEYIYNNLINSSVTQKIKISNEVIIINYNDIIGTQFTGGNVNKKFKQLKNTLNLGIYSKALCGGFINFFKIIGNLGNSYIIYSGIKELSNSNYLVTIHKVLKE